MEKSLIKLEDEISRTIRENNGCTVHFEYKDSSGIDDINPAKWAFVTTYNHTSEETFLLKSASGKSYEDALEIILEYVNNHTKSYASHTIVWSLKTNPKTNTSYFYCKDAVEALEKFFYGKERKDYVIYMVKLNPMA